MIVANCEGLIVIFLWMNLISLSAIYNFLYVNITGLLISIE